MQFHCSLDFSLDKVKLSLRSQIGPDFNSSQGYWRSWLTSLFHQCWPSVLCWKKPGQYLLFITAPLYHKHAELQNYQSISWDSKVVDLDPKNWKISSFHWILSANFSAVHCNLAFAMILRRLNFCCWRITLPFIWTLYHLQIVVDFWNLFWETGWIPVKFQ